MLWSVLGATKTRRGYDAMNRLTALAAPNDGRTQSTWYTYDGAGRLTSTVSGSLIQGYSYNKRGMLTSERQWISGLFYVRAIGIGHNAYGDVEKITYPDGAVFGLFPDALGRPTVLQGGNTQFARAPSYYPDGGLQSYTLGNGLTAVLQRNARQLPSNLSYGQGGNLSFSEDYGYDLTGNLTGINDLVNGHNSQTLAYDGLNRLTEAHAPNSWGTEAYSYDPLNNMRGKLAANLRFTFNYDANNRLANMVVNGGVFSDYRYDMRGNRNYERILYTAHDDSFDAKNQLLAVNGVASYVYDAQAVCR